MTPFEAYQLFLGIKMHFTQPSYDYFKYNGKVNATVNSFNRRRDKYYFAKLAKHRDPLHYLVAQYVSGEFTGWVGDLFTERGNRVYTEYLARRQSLTYRFGCDVQAIADNFIAHFKVKQGQHPHALVLFLRGTITIETMCVLNNVLSFFPIWDKKITDPVIWPSIRDRCIKYTPFIQFEKNKIREIIRSAINNNNNCSPANNNSKN